MKKVSVFLFVVCFLNGAWAASHTLPDGSIYKGSIKDGVFQGKGQINWQSGRFYTGQFENGLFHGYGELLYADKSTYAGNFVNGQAEGQGVYTTASAQRFEGEFLNGDFVRGFTIDEYDVRYEGEFSNFVLHGEGKATLASGAYWKGDFVEGYLHGVGSYIDPEGEHYYGGFNYGQYHGDGELVTTTGEYLKGEFAYGKFLGEQPEPIPDPAIAIEQALYQQVSRITEGLNQIPAGDPNKVELYFVGVAGDGSQRVFEREVLFAQNLFQEKFDLAERSMVLVNSSEASEYFVLATQESIKQTLAGIAQKMNPEQDILFIYMTSHGSKDHEFYLNHAGLNLSDLPAETLAQWVNELPVKHKVVGIGACYSGGFLPLLANDHSLVFTSARADRTSFGCSDDNDFTYFGRAFFEQALAETASFRHGFHKAYELVDEWETEKEYTHSEPQIHAPETMVTYLNQWQQQLSSQQTNDDSRLAIARWWIREQAQTLQR